MATAAAVLRLPAEADTVVPQVRADQIVAIGYTSGSTGSPKPNPKTWRSFCASTALNAVPLGEPAQGQPLSLVATVPPQHMYGMEMSVLLPLLADIGVDAASR